MPLRVAIIGVRGVGKFHAQWYAREGCEVVAFLSSRPDTLAQNEATLKSVLPEFCGLGYADLQEMLEAEQPDAVSVCSPHAFHADHCLEVLAYGAHVLCEKPLVWLGTDRLEETLTQSGAVVKAASQKGMVFALNTQYMAAVPHLSEFWDAQGLQGLPSHLSLTMEAKVRDRDISGVDLWVDLAPHPLSVLSALFPDGMPLWEEAAFDEGADSLTAHFPFHVGAHRISVTLRVRRHAGVLERSVERDGFKVWFEPWVGDDGIYRIRMKWKGGERVVEDFMQVSVRRFVQTILGNATPLCDGARAMRQMEWLVASVQQYLATRR